ncbi:MAG: ABC transporter substrate-binding protein [Actinoplanes sp.]
MKIVAIKAAAVVMLLGGCADVAASPPASSAAVTVTNCGAELEVAAPPQRAVAMEQNATEILLTLGLADRMAGIAYQTDPVLPDLAEAYHGVPVLAKLYPNREKVLATQPDFIYSTFTSAYASDAAGPRADLTGLGVPAYLSRFACETAGEKVTFDGIFAEMREIASLFGVAERGATLVAEQAARLDAAKTSPGTTVLWHYSGTSTPYVAGSGGLPAAISERLGLRNVYADAAQPWPAVHHRLGLVDGPVGAQRHGRRAGQRRTRGAGPVKQLLDLSGTSSSRPTSRIASTASRPCSTCCGCTANPGTSWTSGAVRAPSRGGSSTRTLPRPPGRRR